MEEIQGSKARYAGFTNERDTVRIATFLKINMGQSPPSDSYNDKKQGLPFFQGVSDFDKIYPKPRIWCSDSKKIADVDQILFSVRAPVGEVNLTNLKCCIGRGIAALEPKNSDLRYCFYLLKQFKNQFLRYSQGTTFEAINRDDIAKVKIPYTHNILEQKKIGSIISKVDELIQKTDQVIEQTQRLRKGLMQKLLTKGIGHSDFKKVRMGFRYMLEEYPKEWEIERLVELCKIERGKFAHRPRDDPDYYGGKYPFIQTGDVENSNGYITNFSQTLNEKGLSVSKMFPSGVIVITIAATIGSVAITTFPLCFPDSVVGISPYKIDLKFLYYFLRTRKRFLQISATVSAQPNINLETLKPLLIPVPPIAEQRRIASILSVIDSSIQIQEYHKSKLYFLKLALMQKLLTGKIRVKL